MVWAGLANVFAVGCGAPRALAEPGGLCRDFLPVPSGLHPSAGQLELQVMVVAACLGKMRVHQASRASPGLPPSSLLFYQPKILKNHKASWIQGCGGSVQGWRRDASVPGPGERLAILPSIAVYVPWLVPGTLIPRTGGRGYRK